MIKNSDTEYTLRINLSKRTLRYYYDTLGQAIQDWRMWENAYPEANLTLSLTRIEQ
jgi:hypothetical protein